MNIGERYEAIATIMNMNNIYNQQIVRNKIAIKNNERKIEAIESTARLKSALQSSVDGSGLNFEAYI